MPIGNGLGDGSMGMTAGSGIEGAGEADLRIEMAGDEGPMDDLRLCVIVLGGYMGRAMDVGVPGHEGIPGEARIFPESGPMVERNPMSGGAGLCEEMRRAGISILRLFPIRFGSLSRLSNV